MKDWYKIIAKADGQPAQISVFDEIGAWGVTAKMFIADLKALGAVKKIDMDINSPGGSVFDALAMYNALRATGAEITVKVLGVAASAASLLAMAGDKIVMPENAFMMVHNGNMLVMTRKPGTTGKKRGDLKALYGPSVYQLFRAALDDAFLNDVADRLGKTVVALTADELKKALGNE